MEPSFQFRTLVKFVDAEDVTIEKIRTLGLPPETNNVTSKREPQFLSAATYDKKTHVYTNNWSENTE